MPTLTQLIAETARLLGDTQGNRWLQAIANPPVLGTNDVQFLLIEAADLYAARTGVYRYALTVNVTASQVTASILATNPAAGSPPMDAPTGIILRLQDQNGVALIQVSEGQENILRGDAWQKTKPAQPTRYVRDFDGYGTIWLDPPPLQSSQAWTAFVAVRPTPMLAGTDVPFVGSGTVSYSMVPAHHHYALPYYAAGTGLRWYLSSQNLAVSQGLLAEFDKRVGEAKAEVRATLGGP